jgi:hypothetical protein
MHITSSRILMYVFLFVLHSFMLLLQVCKACNVNDKLPIWKGIAEKRYGKDVAQSTIDCYTNNHGGSGSGNSTTDTHTNTNATSQQWLAMIKDDNCRGGAMPTIERNWKGLYKENDHERYHCCLVSRVCLDRSTSKVLVYFDAKGFGGDNNLKYPLLSCIITILEGRDQRYGSQATKYKCLQSKEEKEKVSDIDRYGQYKGILTFPQREFIKHPYGKFYFSYANSSVFNGDYEPIELFEIPHDKDTDTGIRTSKSFCDKFCQLEGLSYTLKDHHPYINDGISDGNGNNNVEKKRWESHVPQSLMEDHNMMSSRKRRR